jgi:uncharacterized protein
MPVTPTYPGVYIEEVPSGVRTISGVSTSIAAFVGPFRRGPLDRAIRVFSPGDVERELGELHPDSAAGYGLEQFFVNGGAEAYVVRVAGGTPAAAEITLQDDGATGADTVVVRAGRRWRGQSVDDPGVWGANLRVEVDRDTRDPRDDQLFTLRISEIASVGGRRTVVRSEVFANCSADAASADWAVEKVNATSKLVQLSPSAGTTIARPAATGTIGVPKPPAAVIADGAQLDITVGTTTVTATLALDAATAELTTLRRSLERALRAAGAGMSTPDPLLTGATVQAVGGRLLVRLGTGGEGFTGEEIVTFAENGTGTTGADLGLVGAGVVANVQQYVLNSTNSIGRQTAAGTVASDGTAPGQAEISGDFGDKTGMYALRDVDLFNILCLPDVVRLSDADVSTAYAQAITFCEAERAFLLVDIPDTIDEPQEAIDWVDARGVRHRNAAVHFPRVFVADPLRDNRPRNTATSGLIAGLYARTDGSRGVWKAPAGIEASLRGVLDLTVDLTDAENGVLNPHGVNVLRRFPIHGRVAWGARTLVGADAQASEWKYVPVRRLALFLEESLFRGLQWVVFEPNDEPLWSQIRLNVGSFMHTLFRQGAFQGTTPRDAYFVRCDGDTTTQNDIDRGIVNVVVGFAPLKPAEFVIVRIQQKAGDVQV